MKMTAVRSIDDILEFTEQKKIKGFMLAIDFKKVLDSLNRSFMFESLLTFNFGPSFVCWIRTFYQNITSSVMNNVFRRAHSTYGEVLCKVTPHRRICL